MVKRTTKEAATPVMNLDGLEAMSIEGLRAEWRRLFGLDALPRISRPLLLRAVAYGLQEERHGGLSKRAARQLRQAWRDDRDDGRATRTSCFADDPQAEGRGAEGKGRSRGDPPDNDQSLRHVALALKPGTRLVREWQGRAHEVTVLEDGYLWKGTRHGSLSVIAELITGAHWSGPRFFGTRKAVAGKPARWRKSGDATGKQIRHPHAAEAELLPARDQNTCEPRRLLERAPDEVCSGAGLDHRSKGRRDDRPEDRPEQRLIGRLGENDDSRARSGVND